MAQPFSQVSHNRRFATAVFCDTTDRSSKGATSANGMVRPCSCPTSDRMLGWGAKDKEHAMSQTPNTAIAVIGIDIGKNSFHIVGQNQRGAVEKFISSKQHFVQQHVSCASQEGKGISVCLGEL